jgi:SAM-dependent methyltransferase
VARESPADYDAFAWFYHHHWGAQFRPWAVAMLDRVLLPHLPEHSRILDVCCGTGIAAHELSTRGHNTTGVDASVQMLRYAKRNAPEASFICADARFFRFTPVFGGAISTFDSVNHFLSITELFDVFRNVHESLLPGGMFVFDALLEEAYLQDWNTACSVVQDDHACFIRGGYDPATRLGRTELTLFRLNGTWQRSDSVFCECFHPPLDIIGTLQSAGFTQLRCLTAARALGIDDGLSKGRAVFSCTKAAD